MVWRIGTVAALLVALAGCGEKPKGPPDKGEIASEAAKLVKPRPGRYTSLTKLTDYRVPGASPRDADRLENEMKAIAGQTRSYCLTQKEADKGFEDLWRQSQQGDCKFGKFTVEGENLSANMTCTTPQGVTSKVAMEGNGGAESSHMQLTIEQRTRAVSGPGVRMVIEIDNLREGDCK
jgi:hypothetical protein